ncbi:unnamed protein product, partial [Tilletia controversa]
MLTSPLTSGSSSVSGSGSVSASVDGSGGGSAYCSKVNAIIGIDADVEAEVNFVKKLYLVLYAKSRICLAINLPVSLWAPVSM